MDNETKPKPNIIDVYFQKPHPSPQLGHLTTWQRYLCESYSIDPGWLTLHTACLVNDEGRRSTIRPAIAIPTNNIARIEQIER